MAEDLGERSGEFVGVLESPHDVVCRIGGFALK
jgi:hypothetical protein